MNRLLGRERIDHGDAAALKVGHIPCGDGQAMFQRRRGNEAVSIRQRRSWRQGTPAICNSFGHWQDVSAKLAQRSLHPLVQLLCLNGITPSLLLYAATEFSDGDHAEKKIVGGRGVKPLADTGVHPVLFAQFGNDVRIYHYHKGHRSTVRFCAASRGRSSSRSAPRSPRASRCALKSLPVGSICCPYRRSCRSNTQSSSSDVAAFIAGDGESSASGSLARASSRMRPASCSMFTPCDFALRRSLAANGAGTLRRISSVMPQNAPGAASRQLSILPC
jgi:hypothetical protein